MDQQDLQQPGSSNLTNPVKLKWRSKNRNTTRRKPYERPGQQSIVNRFTSSISSIIPAWIKGAASNFLLPVNEQGESSSEQDDDPIIDDDNDVVEIENDENENIQGTDVNPDDDEEEDNEEEDVKLIHTSVIKNSEPARIDYESNHRPVEQTISDPHSPFDPRTRSRYPLTSTARKTKITSTTASRLEKQLAKSKMKMQQQKHEREELDFNELPDDPIAGPSNVPRLGISGSSTPIGNDCGDDDRSSTSENTASSTSGCSSLVPSHQDHLMSQIQSQIPSLSSQYQQQNQSRIHFPKDSLERLRIELMKKKQNMPVKSILSPSDGQIRSASSASGTSCLWSHAPNPALMESGRLTSGVRSTLASSITRSPFLAKQTTYGGSSVRRAARLANANPYSRGARVPPVLHVRVSDRTAPTGQENLSEAARKILESMSSPLEDAKKIPLNESQGLSNRIACQSYVNRPVSSLTGISTSTLNRSNPTTSAATGVKDQSYRMNWPIDLKDYVDKSKQKTGVNPEATTTSSSTTSFTVKSTSQLDLLGDTPSVAAGGKMKSSLSSARISLRPEKECNETLETLSQASGIPNISLPVPKSLPTFNFTTNTMTNATSGPVTQSQRKSVGTPVVVTESSSKGSSVPAPVREKSSQDSSFIDEFPFSSPVSHGKAVPPFTFANNVDPKTNDFMSFGTKKSESTPKEDITSSTTSKNIKTVSWDRDCQIVNQNDNEKTPVSESTVGSKKTVNQVNVPTTSSSDMFSFWSSPATVFSAGARDAVPKNVDTNRSDNQQIGTKNLEISPKRNEPLSSSWLTVKKSDSWTCDSCLLINQNDQDKCPACEEPRIKGAKEAPAGLSSNEKFNFGSPGYPIFCSGTPGFPKPAAPESSFWRCPICMIMNPDVKSFCAACEAIKPRPATVSQVSKGLGVTTTTATTTTSLTLSTPAVSTTPKTTTTTNVTTVTTTSSGSLIAQSISFKSPVQSSSNSNVAAITETPQPKSSLSAAVPVFSFGGSSSIGSSTMPLFGTTTTITATTTTATTTVASSGFSFAIPTSTTSTTTTSSGFSFGTTSTPTFGTASAFPPSLFKTSLAPTPTGPVSETPKNKSSLPDAPVYKFGSNVATPTSSLFGNSSLATTAITSVTTTTTTMLPTGALSFTPSVNFKSPIQSSFSGANPETSKPKSSDAGSMFKFGSTNTGATVSLFGSSTTPATTTTASSGFQLGSSSTSIFGNATAFSPPSAIFNAVKPTAQTPLMSSASTAEPPTQGTGIPGVPGGFSFGNSSTIGASSNSLFSTPTPQPVTTVSSSGFQFGANTSAPIFGSAPSLTPSLFTAGADASPMSGNSERRKLKAKRRLNNK